MISFLPCHSVKLGIAGVWREYDLENEENFSLEKLSRVIYYYTLTMTDFVIYSLKITNDKQIDINKCREK